MVREIASSDVSSSEPLWHEIQAALEEIAELSTSNISSHDFHTALIEKAAAALAHFAGAVWLRSPDGELLREADWNFAATGFDASAEATRAPSAIAAVGLRSGRAMSTGSAVDDSAGRRLRCGGPFRADG